MILSLLFAFAAILSMAVGAIIDSDKQMLNKDLQELKYIFYFIFPLILLAMALIVDAENKGIL